MKHLISALSFIALASLIAIVPASAQERTVVADVPFDFAVGNRVLPTGTYRITSVNNAFQALIDSAGRQSATFAMGYPGEYKTGEQSKLVFDKIGSKYFLKRIIATTAGTSITLPKSKLEKKALEQKDSGERGERTVFAAD